MLDKTKDFINFEPILDFLAIIFENLLVTFDDCLLDIGQVVELFEDISQLSPIEYIFWVKLRYQLLDQLIYIDDVSNARQLNDIL